MKDIAPGLLVIVFALTSSAAQGKKVSYKSGDETVQGMLYTPPQGVPPESVKKFEATLKQLGKRVEIKIYPDAGHAFENPNNKAGYRPDDAADAWKRTITFLADTLKK